MQGSYALEWLDTLVNVTLNPKRMESTSLTSQQTELIVQTLNKERDELTSLLKTKVLVINNVQEIELMIRQYHAALIILHDKANENYNLLEEAIELSLACKAVLTCLEELLSFIEATYFHFLGLDERVPITYLTGTRKDLKIRIDRLNVKLFRKVGDKTLSHIIFEALTNFTNGDPDRHVTFREVLYKKDLVKGLEEIARTKPEQKTDKAINELLIYRNFNKKAYLKYFTEKIADRLNTCEPVMEKLDLLHFSYKEFKQMYRKPNVKLNPNYDDIEDVVGNWFSEEINYFEKKFQYQSSQIDDRTGFIQNRTGEKVKVKLALNADQIALLLRAFVEVGILYVQSINLVFKTIIPFVSSIKQDSLSWESMRKRSYTAEDKDKKAVISILEKAIVYVKKY